MKYWLIKDNYLANNVLMNPISAQQFSSLLFPTMTAGVVNHISELGDQITFGFKGGSGVTMNFAKDPSITIYQPPPDKRLKQ